MKAKNNFKKGFTRCIVGVIGLFAASCGSYENSSYYDRQQASAAGANASGPEYRNYFESLKDNEIITDAERYTSVNDSTLVATSYGENGGWGSQPANITVNVYDNWGWNSWYGPGLGWGWNYGWGWNSWYGPSWGWGWNGGWGWGSWYGGYYGYPYGGYYAYAPYRYNRPYHTAGYAANGGRRNYVAPGGRYAGRTLGRDYQTGRRVYNGNSGTGGRNYSNSGGRVYTNQGNGGRSYAPASNSGTRNSSYTPSRNSSPSRSYTPSSGGGGGRSSGGSGGGGGRAGGGGGGRR